MVIFLTLNVHRRTHWWSAVYDQIHAESFVLTPVLKEAVGDCETSPQHSYRDATGDEDRQKEGVQSGLFFFPPLCFITERWMAPLRQSHCPLRGKWVCVRNPNLASGRGSELYIFKCKNQTDKIFVNIKFPVFFSYAFMREWMEFLFCDSKRQQVQFCGKMASPQVINSCHFCQCLCFATYHISM